MKNDDAGRRISREEFLTSLVEHVRKTDEQAMKDGKGAGVVALVTYFDKSGQLKIELHTSLPTQQDAESVIAIAQERFMFGPEPGSDSR